MVAVSAANIAFSDAWARPQASTIASTECAVASSTRASPPDSAPATTHGSRRPNRDVVRSDSAPNNGFATTETAEPTPVTTPVDGTVLTDLPRLDFEAANRAVAAAAQQHREWAATPLEEEE